METIRTPRIMQETSKGHLLKSRTLGLVPTMGALHEGHLSLVRRARDENDIVAASIFVNPIQFGPGEDFERYPRDIEHDMEKLEKAGVHTLFMPDIKAIYPEGFSTKVKVSGISERLCGAFRPGHFDGVATVVCKLFNLVKPTRAYFGQKDFQQTVLVNRMVKDLNLDVDVIACPTVREEDGLAMSSRNAYLGPEERSAATVIYRTLQAAAKMIKSSAAGPADIKNSLETMLKEEPLVSELQYAGVYDTRTLEEVTEYKKEVLLAIALKIGKTRLIDNLLVEL